MPLVHPPAIEYRGVTVSAPDGSAILDGIDLRISRGERVAFLGRSGAGKTTALRAVNALAHCSRGTLLVEGQPHVPASLPLLRRRIGYVMQQPALFPHRTVFDNVATVPRLLGWAEDRIAVESESLLARLELPAAQYGPRFPRTLSGGQQQRVAIARALVASPPILLCDEPFSALDPLLRVEMQVLLAALAEDRPGTTIVFVTHDVREALRIAGRIVLFDAGRVVADASAAAFTTLTHPLARRFVEASWGRVE